MEGGRAGSEKRRERERERERERSQTRQSKKRGESKWKTEYDKEAWRKLQKMAYSEIRKKVAQYDLKTGNNIDKSLKKNTSDYDGAKAQM